MMFATTSRSGHQSVALRLLLALLLALVPLPTIAGNVSPAANAADDMAASTGHNDHQMPCHADNGTAVDPVRDLGCPHCTGDAPLSQCECCTLAAPPGLISLDSDPTQPPFNGVTTRLPRSSPLPESPGDRLFRPPISPC